MAKAKPTPKISEGVTPDGDAGRAAIVTDADRSVAGGSDAAGDTPPTTEAADKVAAEPAPPAAALSPSSMRVFRRIDEGGERAIEIPGPMPAERNERDAAAALAGVAVGDVFAWRFGDELTVVTREGRKIRVRRDD
ncbi:MAG: hypothetical protein PHS60_10925 [Zavarzinia sp.]|nr:hypothetical protein [Zavarzinia sp.]